MEKSHKIKVGQKLRPSSSAEAVDNLHAQGIHRRPKNPAVLITQVSQVGVSFKFVADLPSFGSSEHVKEYHVSADRVKIIFGATI